MRIFQLAIIVILLPLLACTLTTPQYEPPQKSTKVHSPPSLINWELYNANFKITERTETWWKFAWQVMLKNNTSHIVIFFISAKFLDEEGFVVEDDLTSPPVFAPYEERRITDFRLIDSEIAPDVHSVQIEIDSAFIQD